MVILIYIYMYIPASEEEDDSKSVCPSDGDFPLIDAFDYIK